MTLTPYDIDDLGWLAQATCTEEDSGIDADVFFTDSGHILAAEALEMCRACPVRMECLAHAYRYNHTSGYFGGMSCQKRSEMTVTEALAWAQVDTTLAGTGRRRVPKPIVAKILAGEITPTGAAAAIARETQARIDATADHAPTDTAALDTADVADVGGTEAEAEVVETVSFEDIEPNQLALI